LRGGDVVEIRGERDEEIAEVFGGERVAEVSAETAGQLGVPST